MTTEHFKKLALSFPGTEEAAHFDRRAFKVVKRRIFATLHEESETANLKLSPQDQPVYCSIQPVDIYPVDNKWGLQGWTTFVLKNIEQSLMLDALEQAHKDAAVKKGA